MLLLEIAGSIGYVSEPIFSPNMRSANILLTSRSSELISDVKHLRQENVTAAPFKVKWSNKKLVYRKPTSASSFFLKYIKIFGCYFAVNSLCEHVQL